MGEGELVQKRAELVGGRRGQVDWVCVALCFLLYTWVIANQRAKRACREMWTERAKTS